MFLNSLEKHARKSLTLRRMARRYFARFSYFDWSRILQQDRSWQDALEGSRGGPRVLIATSIGFHLPSITMETVLAVALALRGADVHALLCDAALPVCMACESNWYTDQQRLIKDGRSAFFCRNCFQPGNRMYQSLGIPVHRYSEFLTTQDSEEAEKISLDIPFSDISGYTMDGISVGEHAMAGALRFFAKGTLEEEPFAEPILRQYLKAAIISSAVIRNLFRKYQYDVAVFNHGIYVPQGLTGEVCRQNKVRVVNWNTAYRKRCFVFSHEDTYHHTMITEPVEKWENLPWDEDMEKALKDYLKSRWKGTEDWVWFHDKPNFELQQIADDFGIDFSKPCIGMLTSVSWDAVLHYPANAFPNMIDWIFRTIEYFLKKPELQLIMRVHPAEIHGAFPSRQRMVDEVRKAYPDLPKNIIIIPPESDVSTYALMHRCDSVIIYNTKTGVELSAMGIPVIVAGEAWIRNKEFSISVENPEDYFRILEKLPYGKRMSQHNTEIAKKYAYHFFFRRMIPLEFMKPKKGWPPFKIKLTDLKDLYPNASVGLNVICDGIINGSDFIYQAEDYAKKN